MLIHIKPRVVKTKGFITEHKTLVACACSAAAGVYFTRNLKVRGMEQAVSQLQEHVADSYRFAEDCFDYIEAKGQWDEFSNFCDHKVHQIVIK